MTARANSTGNVFISQSHKKRAGYEAVKNETTRKAEKAYFDRSTRAKEDQIWKLDGQAEAEQVLSVSASSLARSCDASLTFSAGTDGS